MRGAHLAPGESERELIADGAAQLVVTFVHNPRDRLFEADRRTAVANMLLDGMIRNGNDLNLTAAVEKAIADRERLHGTAHYLIFERLGTIRELIPENAVDWLSDTDMSVEFRIADSAVPQTELQRISRDQLSAGIAALALASESLSSVSKAADGFVFFRDDGIPLYSFTPKLSGSAYMSMPLAASALSTIEPSFRYLSGDDSLQRAVRLAVSSLDTSGDNLRAFLAAWAALEIFTHKAFRRYKPNKEKLGGLVPRFTVVAKKVTALTADADVEAFKRSKLARDRLFHGHEVSDAALPTTEVRGLFWRYLRLHVSKQQERSRG